VVAILAIGAIIWHASRVLVEGDWTLEELAAEETEEAKPQTGKDTVRFLLVFVRPRYPAIRYIKVVKPLPARFADIATLEREREAVRAFRSSQPNPNAEQEETVRIWTSVYDQAIRRLDAGVTFALVRERFERAVLAMFVFGAVAIGTIAVFAWAVNPPAEEVQVSEFRVPVRARLDFTSDGQRSHEEVLGPTCVANPVDVVVLSTGNDSADVVTVATPCPVARFAVDAGVGSLSPIDSVRIPVALAGPPRAGTAVIDATVTTAPAQTTP
jgi:hypothetical protein